MENAEGNIPVAELYNNLCGFDDDNHDVEWKRIWKLHVPERVRFLTWLMKHGRLLTNSHKSMMGLGSAMCGYCRDIPETILHVMRDCPLVMPLWLNIVPVNDRSWFFSCNVQQWITMNLCKEVGWNREIDWRNYWAMACHYIWSWRNKENHNENYNRPYNPANVVMRSMRTYNLAVRETSPQIEPRQRVVFVSWKPPPVGWVRLNTDGSCRDGGHIGCGGIIKGSDGEWL
jgi:hypothetical protein